MQCAVRSAQTQCAVCNGQVTWQRKNVDDVPDLLPSVGHMQVLKAEISVVQIEKTALEINCCAKICAVGWRVPKEHNL